MEWIKLETQEEIEKLLQFYNYFEDSLLTTFVF